MQTIHPIRIDRTARPRALESHGDVKLVITGQAVYYLRCYSDGTFDVFGQDDVGIRAIAGVGMDGAITERSLAARRERFCADNGLGS